MRAKSKWLMALGVLGVIAVISLTAFALSLTKPQIELADAGRESTGLTTNTALAEAVRVREFIKEKNMYLDEPEVNQLTMAFIRASEEYGVDLWLLLSVAASESHFRADVVSRAGCIGIMQLKPSTARSLGVDPSRLYDPVVNIQTGTRYLKELLGKYSNISLAVAAYNAGPSRVRTTIPAIRETKQYVTRVSTKHKELIARGEIENSKSFLE